MPIKSVKLPIYVSNRIPDNYEKVFLPLYRNAQTIERRAFSLSHDWILKSKEALLQFLGQGGKLKLIVTYEISSKLHQAFQNNDAEAIEAILRKDLVEPFKRDIPYYEVWLVGYLAYLIVSGILEIKVSIPRSHVRVHDEITFIKEAEDTVCFHGTFFPLGSSQENVDVFVSWDQRDKLRIRDYQSEFDLEWKGKDENYYTLPLPKEFMVDFKELANAYNPYAYLLDNKTKFKLRSYQQEAIDRLEANNWHGMMVVPPGSGEMLTSLFALDQFIVHEPRTIALIVCPNLHQMTQWITTCKQKYPNKQLISFPSEEEVKDPDFTETLRLKLKEDFIIVFATYKLFVTQTFQMVFARNKNTAFYIFDECTLLSEKQAMLSIYPLQEGGRIGITSTPLEWLSSEKANFLKKQFKEIVAEYPLKSAIGKTHSEYEYITFLSEMIISEYSEYKQFTSLITRLKNEKLDEQRKEEKRAEYEANRELVIERAYNKKNDFLYVLPRYELKKIIVYCERSGIKDVKDSLEFSFKLNVAALSPDTPLEDRFQIQKKFNLGQIDVLVTCDAFSEGLEDLEPKAIYLLSSPTSPRIFFKRRGGLVLPQSGKYMAKIYDFITIPPRQGFHDPLQKEIVLRELPRVMELASLAADSDLEELNEYLETLKLEHVLEDKSPQELVKKIFVKEENYHD